MTTVAQSIELFYGIGSRSSYLASTRLERLAAETGCRIRWRPLYSGDLFTARGLFGVPGFVVGDEVCFGNDRLPLVRHALLQARRTVP
ncbi:MAG: hypothetical protein ACREJ0_29155 [Geminicoccaceae bacterium]